mgnify:CR=1 FL=1|jgi:phosphotransferase system enzyme I (PtsI)
MRYHAIGAAPGIAVGPAFNLPQWEYELPDRIVDAAQLGHELQRLYEGVSISKSEIEELKRDISDYFSEEELRIFDAHIAILEDPQFIKEVQNVIREQYKVAEVAVKEVMDQFSHLFEQLEDQVMQHRSLDIRDVGNRLLKHLIGSMHVVEPPDTPYIVVAKELTPSQLAHLDPARLKGIVLLSGSPNSHTAIMARALGIPCVVGLENQLRTPIQSGDLLIIDGVRGIIEVNPDERTLEKVRLMQEEHHRIHAELETIARLPTVTTDGIPVQLLANIGFVTEIQDELLRNAEGVGLHRTEFEYLHRMIWPAEDQLYASYRSAVEKLAGRPYVIRTLDIGADKQLPYYEFAKEDNPSLGVRAIRFSLQHRDKFRTQLRAIVRASRHGPIKLMYPFISSVDEIREANRMLAEVKEELARELPAEGSGESAARMSIETGIMVELPAAVTIIDLLLEEVDFISIGSNDLVQYLLAVDRMNPKVANLYDPYHPAVLRAFRRIVEAARAANKPVSVCGELAGVPEYAPIWIGLGITRLSMSQPAILPLKKHIRNLSAAHCRELTEELFRLRTSEEIRDRVVRFMQSVGDDRISADY